MSYVTQGAVADTKDFVIPCLLLVLPGCGRSQEAAAQRLVSMQQDRDDMQVSCHRLWALALTGSRQLKLLAGAEALARLCGAFFMDLLLSLQKHTEVCERMASFYVHHVGCHDMCRPCC